MKKTQLWLWCEFTAALVALLQLGAAPMRDWLAVIVIAAIGTAPWWGTLLGGTEEDDDVLPTTHFPGQSWWVQECREREQTHRFACGQLFGEAYANTSAHLRECSSCAKEFAVVVNRAHSTPLEGE